MKRRRFIQGGLAATAGLAIADWTTTSAYADDLDTTLAAAQPGDVLHLQKASYLRDYTAFIPAGVEVFFHNSVLKFRTDGGSILGDQPDDVPTPSYAKNRRQFLRSRYNIALGVGAKVHDVRVESVNFASDYRSDREAQHGFHCSGDNELTNISIEYVFGDFLYGGSNVEVRDIRGHGSGRMGIAFTDGSNMLVEGGSLTNVARSVIDLEPIDHSSGEFTQAVDGFTARNLTIGRHGLGFSGGTGGAVLACGGSGQVQNVLLEDITMLESPFLASVFSPRNADGTWKHRRNNFTLRRCKAPVGTSSNRRTYTFEGIDHVLVEEAYQEYSGKNFTSVPQRDWPIVARSCTDLNVVNCVFPGAAVAVG